MTDGDGSTEGQVSNPDPEASTDADDQGGEPQEPLTWDKVAEVLRKEAGFDLDGAAKEREQAAAKAAAAEAGKKAQQTYDPRIAELQRGLTAAQQETTRLRADARTAEIARLPKEQQDAARKLFEGEEEIRKFGALKERLGLAMQGFAAEKAVFELAKLGIEADVEDFRKLKSLAEMEALSANKRAEYAERQLKEKEAPKEKEPPAVSQKPAPKQSARGKPAGGIPWEEQKGSGFKNLGAAIRAQREAEQ